MHPGWDLERDGPMIRSAIDAAARSRRLFPRGPDHDLGPAMLQTLLVVALNPGASVADIAERLELTSQAVSGLLAELAKRKLVKLRRDPDDQRRRRAALTRSGEGRVAAFLEEVATLRRV